MNHLWFGLNGETFGITKGWKGGHDTACPICLEDL